MATCAICTEEIDESDRSSYNILREKGSDSINKTARERNIDLVAHVSQKVHLSCRRNFLNPISAENKETSRNNVEEKRNISLRDKLFNYKTDCILCGKPDPYNGRFIDTKLEQVRTFSWQVSTLDACEKRGCDAWSCDVKARINAVNDLISAEAKYHITCNSNFRSCKSIPAKFAGPGNAQNLAERKPVGKPKNQERRKAFLKVVEFLTTKCNEFTITIYDLIDKMSEYLTGTEHEPYSAVYMKSELKKNFSNDIVFADLPGKNSVVTLKRTANEVIQNFHDITKESGDDEIEIICEAAQIIKQQIQDCKQDKDIYPRSSLMESVEEALAFLPDSLRLFLRVLFSSSNSDLHIASIGQAIMQNTCPRSFLAPLQCGLAIQMHRQYASRLLNDQLHQLGFALSYSEVIRFERCAAAALGVDIGELTLQQFLQFMADNLDHNIRTLDGLGTFHGMGIMATITPGKRVDAVIKRIEINIDDVRAIGKIPIRPFTNDIDQTKKLVYSQLCNNVECTDKTSMADLLWKNVRLLNPKVPLWSGFMQLFQKVDYPGKSSEIFLPMLDMNPSDLTCINSTLEFVVSLAKKQARVPVITFDQPLYWKSYLVIESTSLNDGLRSIVLRLGGFHTEMSFHGCIGHTMQGSGLTEALQLIYAELTVPQMMSGKAIARAVRGHNLIDSVLNSTVTSLVLDEINPDDDTPIRKLTEIYDKLSTGELTLEDLESSEFMIKLDVQHKKVKTLLKKFPTAKLWIQYMYMIDILREFIKAERTGNWKLHLRSIRKMLPFFAACGHNLYAKSVFVYLDKMMQLEVDHPKIYEQFMSGYHTIRRTDRCWAGLSSDHVIEQSLMRSAKTSGGLTRGRGMTEGQRTTWALSTPACSEVTSAMQKLTSIEYVSSEQHKDATPARLKRDGTDTERLSEFFEQRNPFKHDPDLASLTTGIVAGKNVNANDAETVGEAILQQMKGSSISDYTFKKADQIITMDSKDKITIGNEVLHVDPQLMFQRTIVIGLNNDSIDKLMAFELTSYPSSLFKDKFILLTCNKCELADAIWDTIDVGRAKESDLIGELIFVIDGGWLIHRVPWEANKTFHEIVLSYIDFIKRRYKAVVIVFDGYEGGPSTKDLVHLDRNGPKSSPEVKFSADMKNTMKKSSLLSNPRNKQRFINYLSDELRRSGYDTIHAKGDADQLIVETTLKLATRKRTVLIGSDTDLLIVLLSRWSERSKEIFFKSERPAAKQTVTKKEFKVWNIGKSAMELGSDFVKSLPFLHALVGCDTTSHLHGVGKGGISKLGSKEFQKLADVFQNNKASKDQIFEAGEKAIARMYNGKNNETLNELRLRKFKEKVLTNKSHVEPKQLQPTSAAAKFHSLRVYLQVQVWLGVDDLDPTEYGWSIQNDLMLPVMTDIGVAPPEILQFIRCGCKGGCDTLKCTCRKLGLDCTSACKECHGVCANSKHTEENETDGN